MSRPDWDRLHRDHDIPGRELAWWVVGIVAGLVGVVGFVLTWMGGAR